MLTRRQARLLGITSGEDGAASGNRTSSAPQSPTGVAASGLPRVSGYSIACEAISATSVNPGDPPPFTRRLSATTTSPSSGSTAARGYRTNSFFEPSASAPKVVLHVNGGSGGDGGGGRAHLRARQTDALLSKAQAVIDYWAAASTTAGPSICFSNHSTSPRHALCVSSAKAAAHVTGSLGATAKSTEGSSLTGCSARLTVAQLRARWRGVTRNCSSLQASTRATANGGDAPRASAKSVNAAHTAQLSIAACPASTPPSTEFAVETQAGVPTSGGDSIGASQQTDRTHVPCNVAPRCSLALFTSPFYADVAAPTLSASAAALGATEAAAVLPVMHQIPTRRAATTALALRQRKEDVRAQRQRRLCHEVHNQAYMKVHEARMRLLFGLSGTDSRAAATTPSGALAQGHLVAPSVPPKAAHGDDHIAAGEEAYLQSLNPSKSEKVLRVVAPIDAALRRHLTSAYTHASQPTFPLESSSTDQHVRAADAFTDDYLADGFAARRPAILEAAMADATQCVESFTDQLLPYQQEGVRWSLRLNVADHMNGILADDMGLGKTAQTVVYLSCYKDMVERVVQGSLEKLQQCHARLCQRALGLTATAASSAALAREAGIVEEDEMPPWLTWCAEAAAKEECISRRTEEQLQRSSSTIQPRMKGVAHGGSIGASAPLAATAEPAPPAATPELAAARA